jgi:DNA-binding MarR family transcriptional regulator
MNVIHELENDVVKRPESFFDASEKTVRRKYTQYTLTRNQYEIMAVLIKGNPDGSFVDLDQLLERVSYQPTKYAIQFSIRFLIKRGLVVKHESELRRGARRVVLSATELGYDIFRHIRRKKGVFYVLGDSQSTAPESRPKI